MPEQVGNEKPDRLGYHGKLQRGKLPAGQRQRRGRGQAGKQRQVDHPHRPVPEKPGGHGQQYGADHEKEAGAGGPELTPEVNTLGGQRRQHKGRLSQSRHPHNTRKVKHFKPQRPQGDAEDDGQPVEGGEDHGLRRGDLVGDLRGLKDLRFLIFVFHKKLLSERVKKRNQGDYRMRLTDTLKEERRICLLKKSDTRTGSMPGSRVTWLRMS